MDAELPDDGRWLRTSKIQWDNGAKKPWKAMGYLIVPPSDKSLNSIALMCPPLGTNKIMIYHAVPTNYKALGAIHYHVKCLWLRTPRRRSQKDKFAWERIDKLADGFLPKPKILYSRPSVRFAVTHPRWETRG
jgi:hypothetical protein